jgi:hypothetical protein
MIAQRPSVRYDTKIHKEYAYSLKKKAASFVILKPYYGNSFQHKLLFKVNKSKGEKKRTAVNILK